MPEHTADHIAIEPGTLRSYERDLRAVAKELATIASRLHSQPPPAQPPMGEFAAQQESVARALRVEDVDACGDEAAFLEYRATLAEIDWSSPIARVRSAIAFLAFVGTVGLEDAIPLLHQEPLEVRIDFAFNYFLGKGLSREQAAGLVGNMQQESGGKLEPRQLEIVRGEKALADTQEDVVEGRGFGIGQWTTDDRQKDLIAFAATMRRPATDYETQVAFVWYELEKYDYYGLDELRQATSVHDAADVVMRLYERPGVPNFDQRHYDARAIYNRFDD